MIPILNISVWLVAKGFCVFTLGLYCIFALVVIRQVQLMTDTLDTGSEFFIKLLSFAHLAFAAIVLIIALTIL